MEDLVFFVAITFSLLYFLTVGYFSWFQSQILLKRTRKAQTLTKKIYSFMPRWFLSIAFLGGNDGMQIWLARIVSILAIGMILYALILKLG